MGYIGTFGTATTAPEHHCNTFGTPSWSGKHEDEFTSALEQELREFIKREAKRYGKNDRVQNIVGENQNFFNEHFLCGWPHALWLEYYQLGMEERASLDMPSFDEVWPPMPI